MVVRLSDHEARVDGRADVDELLELFDLDLELEDAEEYDTVGGLVYHRIGGVPVPGDALEVGGLRLTVESTDGRRVGKVLVTRKVDGQPTADENGQVAEDPALKPSRPTSKRGAARPKR